MVRASSAVCGSADLGREVNRRPGQTAAWRSRHDSGKRRREFVKYIRDAILEPGGETPSSSGRIRPTRPPHVECCRASGVWWDPAVLRLDVDEQAQPRAQSTYLLSARSCGDRRTHSAATFSSRCAIDDVPGIGTVMGERASNHAMAI